MVRSRQRSFTQKQEKVRKRAFRKSSRRDLAEFWSKMPWEMEMETDSAEEETATPEEVMDELLEDFDEVDLEIIDEDLHDMDREIVANDYNLIVPVSLGLEPGFEDPSAVVFAGGVYALTVFPGEADSCTCSFARIRFRNGDSGGAMASLLMEVLARWLEECRPAFLREPTIENFVREASEDQYDPETCVVLQQGLLRKLSDFSSHRFDNSTFSRLKKRIYLFWPEKCMPMGVVFDEPYHKVFARTWVVEACLPAYRQAHSGFLAGLRYINDASEKERLRKNKFSNLDPEERLRRACDLFKMDAEKEMQDIYQEIMKIISGER